MADETIMQVISLMLVIGIFWVWMFVRSRRDWELVSEGCHAEVWYTSHGKHHDGPWGAAAWDALTPSEGCIYGERFFWCKRDAVAWAEEVLRELKEQTSSGG